jgi:hypothetical protein
VSRFGSKFVRNLSLLAGASFVFFILFTAPHRVHHSFEHSHDESRPTACHAFAVAKGCPIAPVSAIGDFTALFIFEEMPSLLEVWIPTFSPSPFSQRAPPQAELRRAG